MKTEGIKYTGSKNKIIPYILELIQPLKVKKVLGTPIANHTEKLSKLKKSYK